MGRPAGARRVTARALIRALEGVPVIVSTSLDDRGVVYSEPVRIYVNPALHETLTDVALTLVHELAHLVTDFEASESYCNAVSDALFLRSRALQQAVYMALARAMFVYLGGGSA